MSSTPPGHEAAEPPESVPRDVAERATAATGRDPAPARAGTAAVVESAAQIVAGSSSEGRAGSMLPIVLADVPVAVLLIDLGSGNVTYANREAVAMGGVQRLPVPLDQWGAAARLTDLGGHPLADSANPLSDLARGHPVAGEAVLAPRPEGPARTLWVTGFPLSPTGADEQLALVVLLEVAAPTEPAEDPEAAMQALRDRAIIATDFAFTITDPRQDDNPLVWVNPAFSRVTGYDLDEVVGRNCRLLQGPATDRATVEELRQAIAEERPITITVLNYRKDGTAFWNQVAISPVFDGDDRLVSFVGVQSDVTERVLAEAERERAYAAERAARQDAERARHRLSLLAETSVRLGATLDIGEAMERMADALVPRLADWVLIRLTDEHGRVERAVARHRHGREEQVEELIRQTVGHPVEVAALQDLLTAGTPRLVADASPEVLRSIAPGNRTIPLAEELGLRSLIWVPLVARRRILGTISLVSGPSGRVFTGDDMEVAVEVGRRAGLTIENARLYQREHRAAATLQDSLLPDVPERVGGLRLAKKYLVGSTEADVGGDWYEVLPLPDGSIGVAIGDVVGHDLSAAAAMGHLRGVVRACAWDAVEGGTADPGAILERIDRLIQGLHVVPLATLCLARIEPPTSPEASWRVGYASAGHPPLMGRLPDGTVRVLDGGHGMLLGVASSTRRSDHLELPTGTVLVAYTDGLVERRGESIDTGLGRLAAALRDGPADDPEALVDRLIASDQPDRSDDTAVLVMRFEGVR